MKAISASTSGRISPRALVALLVLAAVSAGCDGDDPAAEPGDTVPFRVSVVTRLDDGLAASPFDLGGVEVCQGTACVRADLTSHNAVSDASTDVGLVAGEVRIARDQAVTSLRLLPNARGRAGGLRWSETPIALAEPMMPGTVPGFEGEPRFPGYHAFVVMDGVGADGLASARLAAVAPVPTAYDAAVLYEPARGARLDRDDGLSVEVASGARVRDGAAGEPFVLTYAAVDDGGVGPMVEAFPFDLVGSRVRVRLPIDAARIPEGATRDDVVVRVDGEPVAARAVGGALELDVSTFGTLRVGLAVPYTEDAETGRRRVLDVSGQPRSTAYANDCANALAQARSSIETRTRDYAQYVTTCVDLDTPLHIVFASVRGSTSANGLGYAVRNQMTAASGGSYYLRELGRHATDFNAVAGATMVAAVNGFTWDGVTASDADKGYVAGGRGYLKGTVHRDGVRLSTGSGPEAVIGFSQRSTTSGGLSANLFRRTSGSPPTLAAMAPNNYTAVGSTTSVRVSGACSNSGDYNWWSAVGYGNGYVMMISSAKAMTAYYYQTNEVDEFEMCEVFAAMGMTTAIRLDGATAATLFYNGSVRNPNPGAAADRAGPVRDVAYAVGVTTY